MKRKIRSGVATNERLIGNVVQVLAPFFRCLVYALFQKALVKKFILIGIVGLRFYFNQLDAIVFFDKDVNTDKKILVGKSSFVDNDILLFQKISRFLQRFLVVESLNLYTARIINLS